MHPNDELISLFSVETQTSFSRGLGPAYEMNKFQVEGFGWTLWTLKRGHFNSSSKNSK